MIIGETRGGALGSNIGVRGRRVRGRKEKGGGKRGGGECVGIRRRKKGKTKIVERGVGGGITALIFTLLVDDFPLLAAARARICFCLMKEGQDCSVDLCGPLQFAQTGNKPARGHSSPSSWAFCVQ